MKRVLSLILVSAVLTQVAFAYTPVTSETEAIQILKEAQALASRASVVTRFAKFPTFELAGSYLQPLTMSLLQGHLVLTKTLAIRYRDTLKVLAQIYLERSNLLIQRFHPYGGLLSAMNLFIPFTQIEFAARGTALESFLSYDTLPWGKLTARILKVARHSQDGLNERRARELQKKKPVAMPGQALMAVGSKIPPGALMLETGLSRPELLLDHRELTPAEKLAAVQEASNARKDLAKFQGYLLGAGAPALPEEPVELIPIRAAKGKGLIRYQKGKDGGELIVSELDFSLLPVTGGRFIGGAALEAMLGRGVWVRLSDSDQYFFEMLEEKSGATAWDSKNGAIEIWRKPWSAAAVRVAIYPLTGTSRNLSVEDLREHWGCVDSVEEMAVGTTAPH